MTTVLVQDADFGTVALGWYSGALCLCILGNKAGEMLQKRLTIWESMEVAGDSAVEQASRLALVAFKHNARDDFPPMVLVGTAFQHVVWHALLQIEYGTTASYRDIAQRLGRGGPRSVGTAVGKNPISLFVPCHRVIGTDGGLCGYAWGLALKKKLLHLENCPVVPPIPIT